MTLLFFDASEHWSLPWDSSFPTHSGRSSNVIDLDWQSALDFCDIRRFILVHPPKVQALLP